MTSFDRLHILQEIYRIYDHAIRNVPTACRKHCAHCCTRNVTMTTLEGQLIIAYLAAGRPDGGWSKIQSEASQKRFQPSITTNHMAALCMQGKDLPDESNDPAWGACPLLTIDECPIYPVRPFGCRCMISSEDCRRADSAVMDPFVLTLNNLFLQFIEHIDKPGAWGNFTDVLLFLQPETRQRQYKNGHTMQLEDTSLAANRAIPMLLVPPEHREKIRPILAALQKISGAP
jgi:Fe-S-cluster containining protein